MADNARIKSFVQKTLGCGCPEEVFHSINCRHDVLLSNEVMLNSVITIGSRLLIYVVEADSNNFVEKNLAYLVTTGKSERDSRGLNRVRLVIVADEVLDRQLVQSHFDRLKRTDEKIHLHIISKDKNIFTERREDDSVF